MSLVLDNKSAVIIYRDELADQIDDLTLIASDNTFDKLSALRRAVVNDSHARVAQLPSVVEFLPNEALPALVLAHKLYDDANRDDEIVRRNNARHGGFIPGGKAVEYLK
ncbi:MAG: hypothetical protein JKY93_12630 [Gammaproteobacteria bacterium]|nr:hypothetical protein [Gammaproteobacteria bacterium]